MATWYLFTTQGDLDSGTTADTTINSATATHYMLRSDGSSGFHHISQTDTTDVNLSSGATSVINWVTIPGLPGETSWSTSSDSVQVRMGTTSSDLDCRVRVLRVNSSGTVQDTGSWTSYQTMSATFRTFTPTAPTWGTISVSDRYVIEVDFTDTRPHGGSTAYDIQFDGAGRAIPCRTSTNVGDLDAPSSSQYNQVYHCTNTASDLSTYADGNYVLSTSDQTTLQEMNFTNLTASGGTVEIGFITASGVPNSTSWESNTTNQVLNLEIDAYNMSTATTVHDDLDFEAQVERLNSSGTVQETATASITWAQSVSENTAHIAPLHVSIHIPNKSWTSPAATDRLAVRLLFTNRTSEQIDLQIGASTTAAADRVGHFHCQVTEGAGGTGPVLIHVGVI